MIPGGCLNTAVICMCLPDPHPPPRTPPPPTHTRALSHPSRIRRLLEGPLLTYKKLSKFMTHEEFVSRYGWSVRYLDLVLGGWDPGDPLPEREWGWLGRRRVGSVRLWVYPRDVSWAVHNRMRLGDCVRLYELLEQLVESQGEQVRRVWREEPYGSYEEFRWVRKMCLMEPCGRWPERIWSLPRYVLVELGERLDDRIFWGYVWWLVMRGFPYCFDDDRVSRQFRVAESEARRVRELMFDMGWFVASRWDARRHYWVRKPKGLVAMG